MGKSQLTQRIESIQGKRVLVAPLNWGIGHATRCVPIIKKLIASNKEVVIASDGYALSFLQKEFPGIEKVEFRWTNIIYDKSNSQVWAITRQIPKFLYAIVKEHSVLKDIVARYGIDTVISDNRFGLWHNKAYSIYITHQIAIKVSNSNGFLNKMAYRLHKFIIERYNECWVPDFEGIDNLSGDLSHKYPLPRNTYFIGILSRFQ